MKTISIPGFISCKPAEVWDVGAIDGIKFEWSAVDIGGISGWVSVCEAPLTFQVPDDFSPAAGFIAALEKRREELRAEFQMQMNRINDEISKFQAITCEVQA